MLYVPINYLIQRFREDCNQAVQTAKEKYLRNIGEKLTNPNTSQKCYWSLIHKLLNKQKIPKIPPLIIENRFIINAKAKAVAFNNFFANQCKTLLNRSTLPTFNYLTRARLNSITITEEDVSCVLKNLKAGKANGPDQISSKMLLLCGDSIITPLQIIFNNILLTGIFPEAWKQANVVPIHKKESKQFVKNYRPISLLPICAKVFEKLVFKYLYNYLTSHNLITKKQSGFRPGDSTTYQLLDFVHEIHKSFDHRKSLEVRAVFLDISKAFDKVWHKGLLFKLKRNGIDGLLLNLFSSYLDNRKQRVIINGSSSEWTTIESGVPQGSVLGPLLILIYINDLEEGIQSNVKFFADDTMLYSIVDDVNTTADQLNHDLNLIENWAFQWKMSFNPDPSKQAVELLFSQRKVKPNHPPLFFNNTEVHSTDKHKHLGIVLDPKLTFNSHINEKIVNARKGIGILKCLSSYVPTKTLDQIYKMFVRPHLDYCDIIYHTPSISNPYFSNQKLASSMERIERIQYQAGLAVTGCWQGSNRNSLYEELGWESLSDRRWARRLSYFYKIIHGFSPDYLLEHLPSAHVSVYEQRNPKVLLEINCRTSKYMNSFFPHCVKVWNDIGDELRNCVSLCTFQKSLVSLIRPKKRETYGIDNPEGIKNIFRLRVGLSQLKYQKKKHNFLDTPSDICECLGKAEDCNHFFFDCVLHDTHRPLLLNCVTDILAKYNLNELTINVDVLLYGHHQVTFDDNKIILQSTIRYINDTERFS